MYRKTAFSVAVIALTALTFAAFAMAQTNTPSNAGSNPGATGSVSTPAKSPTPSSPAPTSTSARHYTKAGSKDAWFTTMQNLWQEDQTLSDQWAKINEHYNEMMKISDPNQLKTEMAKHQELVNAFNTSMSNYQTMWKTDMAQYEPGATKTSMTGGKSSAGYKRARQPMAH